ncbi:hypothetical protein [Magnetospirillum fulvum]|nr:hypothetical protein [Magnetospirillum fulvum]
MLIIEGFKQKPDGVPYGDLHDRFTDIWIHIQPREMGYEIPATLVDYLI